MILSALATGLLMCSTPSAKYTLADGSVANMEFNLVDTNTVFPQSPNVQRSVALRWFGQVSETSGNITIVGKDIHDVWGKLVELNPNFEEFNAKQLSIERHVAVGADRPDRVDGDGWVCHLLTPPDCHREPID